MLEGWNLQCNLDGMVLAVGRAYTIVMMHFFVMVNVVGVTLCSSTGSSCTHVNELQLKYCTVIFRTEFFVL